MRFIHKPVLSGHGLFNFIKKKAIPDSLLLRFVLIIIIPTLIGQFFAVHLFYERHWYNVSFHTSSMVASEIQSLLEHEPFRQHPGQSKTYLNFSYIFAKNRLMPKGSQRDIEELEILKKALDQKILYQSEIYGEEDGKIKILIQVHNDLLIILLPAKVLINPTTYIFVLWVILLTTILLTVSLLFSKNQIRSILDLTRAAESYGRGEAMNDYKPSGAREIRMAGLAFIKMKDRIERQSTRRTQMLAMISHDLKTPLTRMKLQVELMNDPEEKEELAHDIDSMQYMISSYLDFARGEGGENFIRTDLNKWLQDYLKLYWDNFNIQYSPGKNKLYINIKPHSFTRALDNIINNATKYSTKIKISVYSAGEEAVIAVEDNGKGIQEAEKKLVFRPFYRGDKARTLEDSTSVGLGLAITREIIMGHYGSISLEKSRSLKGLAVRIKIPRVTGERIKKTTLQE